MPRRRRGASAGLVAAVAFLGLGLLGPSACSDPDVERMEKVRASVCICKDAGCVEAALKELPATGPKQERAAQRLASEIMHCVARVGEMTPKAAEPAAEAPSPTAP